MAFGAFVQSKGKARTNGTSTTLAFDSNNTAGNSIQVGVNCETTGRTITVTDSQGNTYVEDASASDVLGFQCHVISAHNIAGGANTVQVAISGAAADFMFVIYEHEGNMEKDKTANAKDVSGTPSLSPDSGATATTTANDELIFGFVGTFGQTFGIAAGATFSNVQVNDASFGAQRAAGEMKVVSATGTYNATFTIDPSQRRPWICIVVTYKATAAGRASKNTRTQSLHMSDLGVARRMS